MATPPLRAAISGTPSRATANTGFGALWDYVTGLLGSTGNAAEARAALDVPTRTGGNASGSWAITAAGLATSADLSGLTQFAKSLGVSGYQKLPGGLIIQWGSYTTGAGGNGTITFPIAFPTACRAITFIPQSATATTYGVNQVSVTTSQTTIISSAGSSGTPLALNWMAVGY